jgi:RsmE family RNA methyltransferase
MNIILLHPDDLTDDNHVTLSDHRFDHIQQVYQANIGDRLSIGILNGDIGYGIITTLSSSSVSLKIQSTHKAPTALPITLIIALPRPKMIKRLLQTCATMGVKSIIFVNSYRVEKSYWQTPLLTPENINKQLILGLEQGKDTLLPTVTLEQRFKPFVEDRLPDICKHTHAFVAHPNSATPCPHSINQNITLIIGPEGGFIPYEIEKLNQAGCKSIHLGQRILRTETAVPVLLAKLFS